jgi:hypothetical protein
MFMELVLDRDWRIGIEETNASQTLAHATRAAHQHKFDDLVLVDIDGHHYESEHFDVVSFMAFDLLFDDLRPALPVREGRVPRAAPWRVCSGCAPPYDAEREPDQARQSRGVA